MAHIVALELETRAVRAAEVQENMFDIAEGVTKYAIVSTAQIRLFPFILPVREPVSRRVEREVNRAHVERSDLGFSNHGSCEALFECHIEATASGDIDYRIGVLLDTRQELHEHGWIWRRTTIDGIASV